jgi:flavin reductase
LKPHEAPGVAEDDERCSPERFRQAMSHVAGAVHVVTTSDGDTRAGFTATAVTAVSDHPPTILVCANAGGASTEVLIANGNFAVNTLAFDDESLAEIFAGRTELTGDDRFHDRPWETLATGAPILTTSLVSLDCRVISADLIGTHYVIIGQVLAAREGRERRALIYRGRVFHAL